MARDLINIKAGAINLVFGGCRAVPEPAGVASLRRRVWRTLADKCVDLFSMLNGSELVQNRDDFFGTLMADEMCQA